MERTVEYNGFMYTTESRSSEEITKALENAKDLDTFLSDVKTWSEEEIEELVQKKNSSGLTGDIMHQLYDAYYDLCYYGTIKEADFLKRFHLSKAQLGLVLV